MACFHTISLGYTNPAVLQRDFAPRHFRVFLHMFYSPDARIAAVAIYVVCCDIGQPSSNAMTSEQPESPDCGDNAG